MVAVVETVWIYRRVLCLVYSCGADAGGIPLLIIYTLTHKSTHALPPPYS